MSVDVSRYGTWRERTVMAVGKRLRGPLRPKGKQLASDQAVRALADSIAAQVLDEARSALEHHYAPQLHNSMHPADVLIKVFELRGHEGLTEPRAWEDAS